MFPPLSVHSGERGNALFLILIAVVLFAALAYAISSSTRGSGDITREQDILEQAQAEQCVAYIERGVDILELFQGCTTAQISYELDDGTNPNPQAPANETCHLFRAAGAGLAPCGIYLGGGCSDEQLAALDVGERCINVVHVGVSGGNRVYTTLANSSGTSRWNNGATSGYETTGATSSSDGLANTDTLVGLTGGADYPYAAAIVCRNLGAEWYLPAEDELDLFIQNQTKGALNGSVAAGGYWSSTEVNNSSAVRINQNTSIAANAKQQAKLVRCMRR